MRRLALLVVGAAALLAPGADAAGCAPLDCAPSAVTVSPVVLAVRPHGVYGVVRGVDLRTGRTRFRLPHGLLEGRRLVHQDGALLTWFDAATGRRTRDALAPSRFQLAGVARDGRAVVARTEKRSTSFAVVGGGPTRAVTLAGHWQFDALDGPRLFLLQFVRRGYLVRVYDLDRRRLRPGALKDADEPALIAGVPWERATSPGGRWLVTLYVGGAGETMLHRLDLRSATATCIDLPGEGDFNGGAGYGIAFTGRRTLVAISPAYGVAATVDVGAGRVTAVARFAKHSANAPVAAAVAAAPDGERAAAALAGRTWLYDLARQRVTRGPARVAIALGWSTDGRKLWYLGERSRIRSLRLV